MITGQGLLIIFAGYIESTTGLDTVEIGRPDNTDCMDGSTPTRLSCRLPPKRVLSGLLPIPMHWS